MPFKRKANDGVRGWVRVLGLLLVSTSAFAGGDYGLPGEFLNVGAGAKPAAMGRAWTAVADDINAIYWNPAGVAMYRSGQILFQYSPLYLGGSMSYMAYSQPLYSMGCFGLGVANSSSGDLDRISATNPEVPSGKYADRETGYLGTYAYRFNDLFALGTNVKVAEHVMDGKTARGYGMDAGALYQIVENKYKVGLMVRNLVPPAYKWPTDTERFPTNFRAGGAAYFFEDRLLTTMDVEKSVGVSQNPKLHFGLQTYFFQDLFLRLGADPSQLTAGLGFRYKTLEVDYAMGYQDLGINNRMSLKIFFGGYEVDVRAVPRSFSPEGLKRKTEFRIRAANRSRIVNWILSVRSGKNEVVKSFQGFSAPPKIVEWDGRDAHGRPVEAGEYVYRLSVTDSKGRKETTMARSLRIIAPTPFEIEAR
jgi:hypothetical protein